MTFALCALACWVFRSVSDVRLAPLVADVVAADPPRARAERAYCWRPNAVAVTVPRELPRLAQLASLVPTACRPAIAAYSP